jgi:polar amino acid transport system substrate-binding protein
MNSKICRCPLIILLLCSAALVKSQTLFADDKLVLAVPIFPPYAYIDEQQTLSGSGVEKVKQVLDAMGTNYVFKVVANHGVALDLMERGLVDGFFLATQNPARDKVGQMSAPVMYNTWSWFYLANSALIPSSPEFQAKAKIGTRLNTNTYHWLLKNKYLIASHTNEASTLIHMLLNRRLDAVFLSADVFWYAYAEQGLDANLLEYEVQASLPFVCYFAKVYLTQYPGFMEKFNQLMSR